MPTTQPTQADLLARLEVVERRLTLLERRNRLMKRAGIAALGLIAGVAMMAQSARPAVPSVLEARRFILRDSNGRTRADLHMTTGGEPDLDLFGSKGRLNVCVSSAATCLPQAPKAPAAGFHPIAALDTDGLQVENFSSSGSGVMTVGPNLLMSFDGSLMTVLGNGGMGVTGPGSTAIALSVSDGKPMMQLTSGQDTSFFHTDAMGTYQTIQGKEVQGVGLSLGQQPSHADTSVSPTEVSIRALGSLGVPLSAPAIALGLGVQGGKTAPSLFMTDQAGFETVLGHAELEQVGGAGEQFTRSAASLVFFGNGKNHRVLYQIP